VRFWIHGGWLLFDGAKISKSTGGSVLNLDELVASGFEPLAFRYFLLGGHYRQQLSYSDDAIKGAQIAYKRLLRHAQELSGDTSSVGAAEADALRARFRAAIGDDLNAPRALAVVWEAVRSDASAAARSTRCSAGGTVLALGLADARCQRRERRRARPARRRARRRARREELEALGRDPQSPPGSRDTDRGLTAGEPLAPCLTSRWSPTTSRSATSRARSRSWSTAFRAG
jgi:cysteinyl-tRNA synthetase